MTLEYTDTYTETKPTPTLPEKKKTVEKKSPHD